jgi:hypothetical protein
MSHNPNTQKQWRVRFKLTTTNDPTQETIIQASSVHVAKQIFAGMYPNARLAGQPSEIRRPR